jgi:hypothetical protein
MTIELNPNYGAIVTVGPVIPPTPGAILKGMPMGLLLLITYAVDGG